MTGSMLFDGWSDVVRVLAKGAASYVVMVAVLRVSGKRTLAKFNAFDLVVGASRRSRRGRVAQATLEPERFDRGVARQTSRGSRRWV